MGKGNEQILEFVPLDVEDKEDNFGKGIFERLGNLLNLLIFESFKYDRNQDRKWKTIKNILISRYRILF